MKSEKELDSYYIPNNTKREAKWSDVIGIPSLEIKKEIAEFFLSTFGILPKVVSSTSYELSVVSVKFDVHLGVIVYEVTDKVEEDIGLFIQKNIQQKRQRLIQEESSLDELTQHGEMAKSETILMSKLGIIVDCWLEKLEDNAQFYWMILHYAMYDFTIFKIIQNQ
jgi:hypothetical protein